MADDIKITSGSGSTSTGGGITNPAAGTPVPGGSQPQPAANAGQGQQTTPPATSPAAAAGTPAPAKPQPAAKKAGTINLEEAAYLESQTTIKPPEKYTVPSMVKEKFPDLIQLIKTTESMNDEERDYWFQILPIMTEEQIKKFRDILLNEKMQLSKLDKEYESELNQLNQKHMIEWKEFESKEKRRAITEAETKSKEEEKTAEEDLLKRLSQT
jgi:hypothetical protein